MLRQIPKELIQPGFRLPGALRDKSGIVILKAGTCLTDAHIANLGARSLHGVYADSDWPEDSMQAPARPAAVAAVSVSHQRVRPTTLAAPSLPAAPSPGPTSDINVVSLRCGMRLTQGIYDQGGLLLLAAGTQITPDFLDNLRRRGIVGVTLRSEPAVQTTESLQTAFTQRLDDSLQRELSRQPLLRPIGAAARPRLRLDDLMGEVQRGMERQVAAGTVLAETFQSLSTCQRAAGGEIRGIVCQFTDMISLDFDLLPMIVAMQQPQNEYLFDHCVNGSLLSMAIAGQLGMDREHIMEVGIGALLQDVGMLRVPEAIRHAPRTLTPAERSEIECHPIHTLAYLERIDGLSAATRLIGYQVHERPDQSGYPRRQPGPFIHEYAKIVAIADAYTAMTQPRPYRPSVLPYEAARTILVEASLGKFDRAMVRAFLDCVALFPIGSWVELNNGLIGKVLRANPGCHTRPVIAETNVGGEPTGVIVNLLDETHLKVIRTLTPLGQPGERELVTS